MKIQIRLESTHLNKVVVQSKVLIQHLAQSSQVDIEIDPNNPSASNHDSKLVELEVLMRPA
ncbi:MAG: hypothetical protein IGS48_11100 [Oscillatoriales cyanobacterium C42_A2020_001]|nr:hypothetical protein [Leptolyngbyaceae cyanobacterium C42_A2020_001]